MKSGSDFVKNKVSRYDATTGKAPINPWDLLCPRDVEILLRKMLCLTLKSVFLDLGVLRITTKLVFFPIGTGKNKTLGTIMTFICKWLWFAIKLTPNFTNENDLSAENLFFVQVNLFLPKITFSSVLNLQIKSFIFYTGTYKVRFLWQTGFCQRLHPRDT